MRLREQGSQDGEAKRGGELQEIGYPHGCGSAVEKRPRLGIQAEGVGNPASASQEGNGEDAGQEECEVSYSGDDEGRCGWLGRVKRSVPGSVQKNLHEGDEHGRCMRSERILGSRVGCRS